MLGKQQMSRSDMINWMKETFKVDFQKMEQLSTGVVFANIVNAMYPNKIQMAKLVSKPKSDLDNSTNLALIKKAINALKLPISFDIEKIAKANLNEIWEAMLALKDCYDKLGSSVIVHNTNFANANKATLKNKKAPTAALTNALQNGKRIKTNNKENVTPADQKPLHVKADDVMKEYDELKRKEAEIKKILMSKESDSVIVGELKKLMFGIDFSQKIVEELTPQQENMILTAQSMEEHCREEDVSLDHLVLIHPSDNLDVMN